MYADMTAKEFAEQMKVDYRTALNWLKAELVPGAKWVETPVVSYWEIPASAVGMDPPRRGPKLKPKRVTSKGKGKSK
jgi:hypothetical protein